MDDLDYKAFNDRPPYLKTMNTMGEDPYLVCTPPLHTGHYFDSPPKDEQLLKLTEQFRAGDITCQEAFVSMKWIRPFSDYTPRISNKFKRYIENMRQFGDNYGKGPVPLVLYEEDGQLIMSADYNTYQAYREEEHMSVHCLILGSFTERRQVIALEEPFSFEALNLVVKDELMNHTMLRIALLLRGEHVRIETRKELEAIGRKDFQDFLKQPVEYEPDYANTMNKHDEDPNLVLTPPIHTGYFFSSMPEDGRYNDLVKQARGGLIDCQYVSICMSMIQPHSDYKPVVSDELLEQFEAAEESCQHMTINVYEQEGLPGRFVVSGGEENYAIYEIYRQKQELDARCIILGPYTKMWAVGEIDKPFRLKLADHDPYKTAEYTAKRISELRREKHLSINELVRLAGLDNHELANITDALQPQLPTLDVLERIAKVLEVKSSDILPF
jgi:DNA-binding Xre family transcriptional regulator